MHFFKQNRPEPKKINPAQYELLKKNINSLSSIPKKWPYLGESEDDGPLSLKQIQLHAWSISPPFIQVRYRLIVESLQKIEARVNIMNEDGLDDTDILALITIAEYTLLSAPRYPFYQVANALTSLQVEAYQKAAEKIEQKFCVSPMNNIPNWLRNYTCNSNPYYVLASTVKKSIFRQINPQKEDPDMYLSARISATLYSYL